MNIIKILLSLDCIFDTMLGSVKLESNDWYDALKDNVKYSNRTSNKLSLISSDIDDDRVGDRYAKRDVNTLRISPITPMLDIIADHASVSNVDNEGHPDSTRLDISINTYPYILEKDELRELFTQLKTVFGVDKLLCLSRSNKNLTPKYIKRHFDTVVLYDMDEWVGYQIHNLKLSPMPAVTFVFPLHLVDKHSDVTDVSQVLRNVQTSFAGHLDIDLLSLRDMSYLPRTSTD